MLTEKLEWSWSKKLDNYEPETQSQKLELNKDGTFHYIEEKYKESANGVDEYYCFTQRKFTVRKGTWDTTKSEGVTIQDDCEIMLQITEDTYTDAFWGYYTNPPQITVKNDTVNAKFEKKDKKLSIIEKGGQDWFDFEECGEHK